MNDPAQAAGLPVRRDHVAPQRRDASVLVPVYRDGAGALRLVLMRRAEGGIHGGQLAFPGGRAEPHDATAWGTALRESEEEIGLARAAVTLLEALPVVETRSTGMRIAPFLGRIVPPAAWTPDPVEVAEVLDVAIADLARPEARGASLETFPGWPAPTRIEFLRIGDQRLWGASYRIFEPLMARLLAGAWTV